MNNADIPLCEILCEILESKMYEILDKINGTDSAL
jgi:hypothetical protein